MLAPMRIVSLLPSATEIVCALGAADQLVGISHECDYPDEIRDRAVLTSSRIISSGSSLDIDRAVRGVLRDALSIYDVDTDQLAAVAPDVIITQDLCEVCAVSLDDVRTAVARLAHRDTIQIVSLRPTRFGHVLDDIHQVAHALARPARGRALRLELNHRIHAIAARAAHAASDAHAARSTSSDRAPATSSARAPATFSAGASPTPHRPRVVSIEWLDPLMLGGTWMPELIELAGGLAVGASAGAPAPTISPTELAALQPDVVLIKPCGFSMARTLTERSVLQRNILDHVGPARVYLSDGNAFFNRPGPRLLDSLEILAACIHPGAFADLAHQHAAHILQLA